MPKLPPSAIFFGVVGLIIALPAGAYLYEKRRMERACDEAIMAQLKAPATYKRIETVGGFQLNSSFHTIVYDAENGFGVPIRSRGVCMVKENGASWVDEPKPDGY